MANRATVKTTYAINRTIQPIYTGGSVSLSQDGRILATTLNEDALLTDITTGGELCRIEGDGEVITTLALTPDASHLIICSRSLSMRIYSLKPSPSEDSSFTADLLRTLKPHTAPVVTLTVDRTSTLLATGGADGIVKVWDIRGGYTTHTFHGHSGVISALHFFQVETTQQHEPAQGKKKKNRRKSSGTEDVEADELNDATVEYRLASGAEDGKVRIWDLHKRKSVATLDSHASVVRALEYSTEEKALVSGSRDRTLIIWDAKSWKSRRTILVSESVEAAGFLSNGSIVYSGGERGRLRLWVVSEGRELTKEQGSGLETEGIIDIIHHEKLPYLLTIHADQTLLLHSISPLSESAPEESIDPLPVVQRISGTHDEVIDLAYIGPDRNLLALNTNSEDVRIISLDSSGHGAENPAGRYFGADVSILKGHEDIIICLDVDWSGHWLATGAKDNTARLWRLDPTNGSYTCAAVLTGHAESLGAIALPHTAPPKDTPAHTDPLSHPPAFLLTGSQDKTVKRWDISALTKANKKLRATYTRKAHDKDINALDINPTSTLFASASQDRTVKICDTSLGENVGVLRGHRRGVWTVKFAPKDAQIGAAGAKGLIATGSGDKTVKIWSLADYSCLLTLEGHTNSVLKLAWLPSRPLSAHDKRGAQLASAAGDGLVKIWDSGSGECTCTLDNHEDRVWALTVHPATSTLVSGGGDSVITFWADATSATLEAATTAETERVELEQKLENLSHKGNYREAITLALQMNQPARLLTLFKHVVESEDKDEDSLSGLRAVDDVLAHLADSQLYTLLLRLRDWNTNARTAPVAQRILGTLVRSYSASRLAGLRPGGKVGRGEGLGEVLGALMAYSERHYRRVEELVDESYLLDFTLGGMDEIAGMEAERGMADGDVVMLE